MVKKGISVPFDMKASVGVTPDGLIRIHTESMKGFGVPVNPLLKVLRVQTDDLIASIPAMASASRATICCSTCRSYSPRRAFTAS